MTKTESLSSSWVPFMDYEGGSIDAPTAAMNRRARMTEAGEVEVQRAVVFGRVAQRAGLNELSAIIAHQPQGREGAMEIEHGYGGNATVAFFTWEDSKTERDLENGLYELRYEAKNRARREAYESMGASQ